MHFTDPDPQVWLRQIARLVSDLHHGVVLWDEKFHRPRIETIIPQLRDRIGRSTSQKEQLLLTTLEMRARALKRG